VASNWENIGVLLDIDDGPLSKIKADNKESGDYLREMLRVWRKKLTLHHHGILSLMLSNLLERRNLLKN
jgi:hypothetical protein